MHEVRTIYGLTTVLAIDVQCFLWVVELNAAARNRVTLFLCVEVSHFMQLTCNDA